MLSVAGKSISFRQSVVLDAYFETLLQRDFRTGSRVNIKHVLGCVELCKWRRAENDTSIKRLVE